MATTAPVPPSVPPAGGPDSDRLHLDRDLYTFGGPPGDVGPFRQPFLVFPALVWAAMRFGQRAAVTTTFLLSAAAVAATTFRMGPFARHQLHEGLLAQQVFLGVVAVGVLLLGAVVAERGRVQEASAGSGGGA